MVSRPAAAHKEASTTTVRDWRVRDGGSDERVVDTNLSTPFGGRSQHEYRIPDYKLPPEVTVCKKSNGSSPLVEHGSSVRTDEMA